MDLEYAWLLYVHQIYSHNVNLHFVLALAIPVAVATNNFNV